MYVVYKYLHFILKFQRTQKCKLTEQNCTFSADKIESYKRTNQYFKTRHFTLERFSEVFPSGPFIHLEVSYSSVFITEVKWKALKSVGDLPRKPVLELAATTRNARETVLISGTLATRF